MRTTLIVAATAAAVTSVVSTGPASAASPPLSGARTAVHFDLAAGQTPENFVVEPNGSVAVTFVGSRQVAHVALDGRTDILATLPLPQDGGTHTPITGAATPTGIVRTHDGTLYVAYAAGDSDLTGVWRLRRGGALQRVTPLPADSFPNGLALDAHGDQLYIADSNLATVWRVPVSGGTPTAWARSSSLARTSFAGSNGLKVHDGAVWTTNTDAGTLLRLPVGRHGASGQPQVRATGLTNVDDFAFTGRGDQVLAALFGPNQVVLVDEDGTHRTVLGAGDGLENPTAVAVRHHTVYVDGSARATRVDPNLVLARLDRH